MPQQSQLLTPFSTSQAASKYAPDSVVVRGSDYNNVVNDITELYAQTAGPSFETTNYGLTATGTSFVSTTTICSYATNVFTTVTTNNFACKLPQPTTGKSLVIVNKSTVPLYVYPSNVGGQINNLPIDAPFIVPADGKGYFFFCIENPLPGQWAVTSPNATSQFIGGGTQGYLEFTHTNGVATTAYGTLIAITGLIGGGVDPNGAIILSGGATFPDNWGTLYSASTPNIHGVKLKWQTNIPQTGTSGGNPIFANGNGVLFNLATIVKTDPSSAAVALQLPQGTAQPGATNPLFIGSGVSRSVVSGGPATTGPYPVIGDNLTLEATQTLTSPYQLGSNAFSPVYFTFSFEIPAARPTFTYRIIPYLEFY